MNIQGFILFVLLSGLVTSAQDNSNHSRIGGGSTGTRGGGQHGPVAFEHGVRNITSFLQYGSLPEMFNQIIPPLKFAFENADVVPDPFLSVRIYGDTSTWTIYLKDSDCWSYTALPLKPSDYAEILGAYFQLLGIEDPTREKAETFLVGLNHFMTNGRSRK